MQRAPLGVPRPRCICGALPHGIPPHLFARNGAVGRGFNGWAPRNWDWSFALSPLPHELRRATEREGYFGLSTVRLCPFSEFHAAMISAALYGGQGKSEARRSWPEFTTALQMAPMKLAPELRLQNLEILVKEKGTLDKVAAAGGTSSVYLSQLRNGAIDTKTGKVREMGSSMARRLEVGCDKPRGWMDAEHEVEPAPNEVIENSLHAERERFPQMFPLVAEHGSTDELERAQNDSRRLVGKVALAVMDVRASMGHGALQPSHDSVVMSIVCDETWLRRHATFSSPDQLALITGIGDSMFPTFEDGDPLLVDRAVTDIKLDAVYVLSLNDELFIKRVQRRLDGTIMMISDNEKYPPQHVTDMQRNRFSVLGRVVMVWNPRRI